MIKEDEEESFGNKYVAQTALLKVESGKKTVTILLTANMKGIEFSYYLVGSLFGDTQKGKAVSNVTVAGEVYSQGFEIPVMTDVDIGLQFSVPVMPLSPSARLRIDYGKAVLISAIETTVTPQVETTIQIPTTEVLTQVPEATTHVTMQKETTIYVNETPTNETISSIYLMLFSSVIITYIIPIVLIKNPVIRHICLIITR